MPLLEEWLRRKQQRGVSQLPGLITVGYEFNRVLGPRSLYGRVRLLVQNCDEFQFASKVEWPDSVNYDEHVLDGILDALVGWQHKLLVARFELQEIGWHSVNSAPIAYYLAAKRATQSLLIEHGESRN